jgi:RND family efflux transporter MFP subunit
MAREQERRAAASLRIAEKGLRDALVLAPIGGRVSKRLAEPGESGKVGTPVVRIDDPSRIEAIAFLPGQFYARVRKGESRIRIAGTGGDWSREVRVSYRSPVVDPSLRTFEVRALLPGDGERVVPGVLVNMEFLLNERKGLGVPASAVLERSSGKVIFVTDGKTARPVSVETGYETDGWAEIRRGALKPGESVVVEGQSLLDPGTPVRIQREAP